MGNPPPVKLFCTFCRKETTIAALCDANGSIACAYCGRGESFQEKRDRLRQEIDREFAYVKRFADIYGVSIESAFVYLGVCGLYQSESGQFLVLAHQLADKFDCSIDEALAYLFEGGYCGVAGDVRWFAA
jgi:hypothetical protein